MPRHPFRSADRRFDFGKWLMLLCMFAFSYLVFSLLLKHPTSDISIHTTWAGECSFEDLSTFLRHGAHPLWHLLVMLPTLAGVPLEVSSALVTALCKVAEVWLIHRLMSIALHKRYSRTAITLLSAACAMVFCLWIPCYNPTVYAGVGSPNTWHSCTQLIAQVFMLWCVPYVAYCYDGFTERLVPDGQEAAIPWRKSILLGVMLLLSLLAKPTFMQAFLPAACLFFLYQWIRHPRNSRFFLQILVCVLPSIVFMIVQYMYYFGIIVPWQAGMEVQFGLAKCWNVLIRTVLILAFPLYAILVTHQQKADTCYVLTLLFNAVAILEFLILGENGRRASDGNFGWGMMGAALMLWVLCLIRFLKQTDWKRHKWRDGIGWGLLAWHLLSGLYYIVYLFASGNAL